MGWRQVQGTECEAKALSTSLVVAEMRGARRRVQSAAHVVLAPHGVLVDVLGEGIPAVLPGEPDRRGCFQLQILRRVQVCAKCKAQRVAQRGTSRAVQRCWALDAEVLSVARVFWLLMKSSNKDGFGVWLLMESSSKDGFGVWLLMDSSSKDGLGVWLLLDSSSKDGLGV